MIISQWDNSSMYSSTGNMIQTNSKMMTMKYMC